VTIAVGLITDPHHAEAILQAGDSDLIAIAREAMANPNWSAHEACALNEDSHALLPPDYAYRLRGRDRTTSDYPPGTDVAIPLTEARQEPYTWFERSNAPDRDTHWQ
jgi:tRNA-dihydrouridine synthase